MNRQSRSLLFALLALPMLSSTLAIAQEGPQFVIDPTWPKPLPAGWIHGQLGGTCVDSEDRIAVVDRRNITLEEMQTSVAAPPIQIFDIEGNLITAFGDPQVVPASIHGCVFDSESNIYVAGNADGMIQKYNLDGELLLQIGFRGAFDSSTGLLEGSPQNTSKILLFRPSDMAVDPGNGDIYISDGYGNRRIVVFNKDGEYLRQWGRQASIEEMRAGEGGAFSRVVHCITMSNEGLLYVCDRQGDRIQVFNKRGRFVRNIWVNTGTGDVPDYRGSVWSLDFSPDEEQRHIYVMNGFKETVHVIDHESGELLSGFGRPGHYPGDFTHGHTIAVDSRGNIYVAETATGRRIQRFKPVD